MTRGHRSEGHTADAAVCAWASSLPALFEEAAMALVDLADVVPPGTQATEWHDVEVRADDLDGLAFAWLNELIGLIEVAHHAIVATAVGVIGDATVIEESAPVSSPLVVRATPGPAAWCLVGRVGLHAYDDVVQALRHVKAATFHGLRVTQAPAGWSLHAVVDL
jgi:SHS2 domain-containing protein